MSSNSDSLTCNGPVGTVPVFEANQILSYNHLNDLRDYLYKQDRSTRTELIGMGIVCGMEVKCNVDNINPSIYNSILISNGVGVTSEGHLIESEPLLLTNYRAYSDPAEYEPFWSSDGKIQLDLWELLPDPCDIDDTTSTSKILPLTNLTGVPNMILLMYLEIYDQSQKSCFSDSCDGKGKKRIFSIRRLLINKPDIEKFISDKKKKLGAGLDDFFFKQYQLPEVGIGTVSLSDVTNIDQLRTKYKNAITPVIPLISDGLNQAYTSIKGYLNSETNPFSNIKTTLTEITEKNNEKIQYVYDFLFDIICAYQEFKTEAFELKSRCCPSHELFPMHLMLGELTQSSDLKPSAYRNIFLQPPVYNLQSERIKKSQRLFKRMALMVKNFAVPSGDGIPVKITPSLLSKVPLSAASIPFYYQPVDQTTNENLYEFWNFELAKQNESYRQLSYQSDAWDKSDFVLNPLNYNHCQYNFLRIEGHQGKELKTAVTKITEAQTSGSLPFSLLSVCINNNNRDSDFNKDFNEGFKTVADGNKLEVKFAEFLQKYPGMEHIAGVQKGGTFILAYQETVDAYGEKTATVLADFSLPYFVQFEKQHGNFNKDFNDSYSIENN